MENYIKETIKEAKKAYKSEEVPVGAVLVFNNKIIARSHNNRHQKHDVLGHAEINCIKKASKKIKDWRLDDMEMYVTLKPCKMCEEIIKQSRIKKVYYLLDSKESKNENMKSNIVKIDSKMCDEYKQLIQSFFKDKR